MDSKLVFFPRYKRLDIFNNKTVKRPAPLSVLDADRMKGLLNENQGKSY